MKQKKTKIKQKIYKKKLNYKNLKKAFLMIVFNLKITKLHPYIVQEAIMQINYYKNRATINKFYKIQVKIL